MTQALTVDVGRVDLQARIADMLSPARPAGVVLVGPAGIGKTALWRWSIEHARATGASTLVARCTASEVALPWVGSTDMLAGVEEQVERLPAPQCEALLVAMLRRPAEAVPPDDRTVGTDLLSLLTFLATDVAVLLAI